jgi:hypothetical protein
MFISIGPNCHPAGNLQALGFRNISLPFDWLLIEENSVFYYVNDCINTNFENFTKELIYNHRNKVVSKYYDFVEFFHYDLIKNVVFNRPLDEGKQLLETMNRRAIRFMNIITKKDNEVIFLCMLHHTNVINNGNLNNIKLYKDMVAFDNNNNIKCSYKIVVYLYNDNDDYELILPKEFLNLTHFIFLKYIRNQTISKVYGDSEDFKTLLIPLLNNN